MNTRIMLGFIIGGLIVVIAILVSTRMLALSFVLIIPLAVCCVVFTWARKHEKYTIAQCKEKYVSWKANSFNPDNVQLQSLDYKLESDTLKYIKNKNELRQRQNELELDGEEINKQNIQCYKCNTNIDNNGHFYVGDYYYHVECVGRLF